MMRYGSRLAFIVQPKLEGPMRITPFAELEQGLVSALRRNFRGRRGPRLAQRKPHSERVRRQTFGRLFPGAIRVESTR